MTQALPKSVVPARKGNKGLFEGFRRREVDGMLLRPSVGRSLYEERNVSLPVMTVPSQRAGDCI